MLIRCRISKTSKSPRRETKKQVAHAERYFNDHLVCRAEWHRKLGGHGRIRRDERCLCMSFWICRMALVPLEGIPSHDTLSDALGRIDPQAFQEAFFALGASGVAESVRRTNLFERHSRRRQGRAFDECVAALVGRRAHWGVTQQAVGALTNEITAIPDLFRCWILEVLWYRLIPSGAQEQWTAKEASSKPLLMPKPIIFWC